MRELQELFDVRYGHSLELNKLETCEPNEGVAFVSRKSKDNGISAFVKEIKGLEPAKAGQLTCALSGNGVLSTFIQERDFYTAYHVAILNPKLDMNRCELLYYALCIAHNRYKYSWGRQANRTLRKILIPSIEDIPDWVYEYEDLSIVGAKKPLEPHSTFNLNTENWKTFRYDEIFKICKGYYNKKPPKSDDKSDVPFIGATDKNNGITSYINFKKIEVYSKTGKKTAPTIKDKIFEPPCITISNNGSVGEAFFQDRKFTCSHDVNPVYLREEFPVMNKYVAMFLITLIKKEKYRWGYGRKWRPIRMPSSLIKLPVDSHGRPDWNYMEKVVRGISYSSSI